MRNIYIYTNAETMHHLQRVWIREIRDETVRDM